MRIFEVAAVVRGNTGVDRYSALTSTGRLPLRAHFGKDTRTHRPKGSHTRRCRGCPVYVFGARGALVCVEESMCRDSRRGEASSIANGSRLQRCACVERAQSFVYTHDWPILCFVERTSFRRAACVCVRGAGARSGTSKEGGAHSKQEQLYPHRICSLGVSVRRQKGTTALARVTPVFKVDDLSTHYDGGKLFKLA